ncbi:hypothetical protein SCYAM73S_00565 [Streptomyces cyaneofuscatus]
MKSLVAPARTFTEHDTANAKEAGLPTYARPPRHFRASRGVVHPGSISVHRPESGPSCGRL